MIHRSEEVALPSARLAATSFTHAGPNSARNTATSSRVQLVGLAPLFGAHNEVSESSAIRNGGEIHAENFADAAAIITAHMKRLNIKPPVLHEVAEDETSVQHRADYHAPTDSLVGF